MARWTRRDRYRAARDLASPPVTRRRARCSCSCGSRSRGVLSTCRSIAAALLTTAIVAGALTFAQSPAPRPRTFAKHVLAWADVRNGYQHDSISHAVATIERLGRESGEFDTVIRTDSQP